MVESTNTTSQLRKLSQLEFWWQPDVEALQEECSSGTRMPGFSISWKTMNGTEDVVLPKKSIIEVLYGKNSRIAFLLKYQMRGMIQKAKQQNLTNTEIWEVVIKHKENLAVTMSSCSFGFPEDAAYNKIIYTLKPKLMTNLPKVEHTETKEDLHLTYDIFSYLFYCNEEASRVYIFYKNLLKTHSVSSILQATVNNLQSTDISQSTTFRALKQIYQELDDIIGLQSGNILQALSDTAMLENMQMEGNAFVSKNGKNIMVLGKFIHLMG